MFQAICIINNVQILLCFIALFLVYLYIEIAPFIMYYNINKKTNESEDIENMTKERFLELEDLLTKNCHKYEKDCTTCPYKKECDEYIRLSVEKMEVER